MFARTKFSSTFDSKNQRVSVSRPLHRHRHPWSHLHRIPSLPRSSWVAHRGVLWVFVEFSRVFSWILILACHVSTSTHRYCRAFRWRSVQLFAQLPILAIERGDRLWGRSDMRSKIPRPHRRGQICEFRSLCWWYYFSSIVTVMNTLARVSRVIWR